MKRIYIESKPGHGADFRINVEVFMPDPSGAGPISGGLIVTTVGAVAGHTWWAETETQLIRRAIQWFDEQKAKLGDGPQTPEAREIHGQLHSEAEPGQGCYYCELTS